MCAEWDFTPTCITSRSRNDSVNNYKAYSKALSEDILAWCALKGQFTETAGVG